MKMTQVYDTGSGSLAGTTARIVDGVMIVGKRILKNTSKTIKQIFQRDKQRFVRTVADSIKLDIIDNFWPKPRALVSGYNDFNSKNLLEQTKYVDDPTLFEPDKLKLVMSKGSLEAASFIGANTYKASDGQIILNWEPIPNASGKSADLVVSLIYDISSKFPYYVESLTRGDGTAALDIPAGLTLSNLVAILFCWRLENGKQIRSNSVTTELTAG